MTPRNTHAQRAPLAVAALMADAGKGRPVAVTVGISGSGSPSDLLARIAGIPGVLNVEFLSGEDVG